MKNLTHAEMKAAGDDPNTVRAFRDTSRMDELAGLPEIKDLRKRCPAVNDIFLSHFKDAEVVKTHQTAKELEQFLEFSSIKFAKMSTTEKYLYEFRGLAVTIHEFKGITLYQEGDLNSVQELARYRHTEIDLCLLDIKRMLGTSESPLGGKKTPVWVSKLKQKLFGGS